MSFYAILRVDGVELAVLHCGFRFSQATDATGKPTSIALGGKINLIVESNGKTELFDWMISPTLTKSGSITFYRRDSLSSLKVLEFGDAHCVDYYETFDSTSSNPMQIQLTISAHEIKFGDSQFKNNWPE